MDAAGLLGLFTRGARVDFRGGTLEVLTTGIDGYCAGGRGLDNSEAVPFARSDRPDGATLSRNISDAWRGVWRERFGAKRFVVQQEFNLFTIAVDFDSFVMSFQISRCPIGELCLAAHKGIESRITWRRT